MSNVTWFVIDAYYIVMKKNGILPVFWKGGIFYPFLEWHIKLLPYGCTYTKVEEREEIHVHSHSKKIMFKYNNFFYSFKKWFRFDWEHHFLIQFEMFEEQLLRPQRTQNHCKQNSVSKHNPVRRYR